MHSATSTFEFVDYKIISAPGIITGSGTSIITGNLVFVETASTNLEIHGYSDIQPGTIDMFIWYTAGAAPTTSSSIITIQQWLNGGSIAEVATGTISSTAIAT
jgi:hypothetical protein